MRESMREGFTPANLSVHTRRVAHGLMGLDYGPPVVAFIVATMLLYMGVRTEGSQFFSAINWFRWDSFNYQAIASHGYELHTCTPIEYQGSGPPYCGDAAWFPGYPVLLAVLDALGLPQVGMAVALSWFFDLALLVLIWNAFLRMAPPTRAWLALIFVACCPGGIFMRAAFPMSMELFLMVLWLWTMRERRWVWAGIIGGAATFTYTTAFLLVPLGVAWVLVADRRTGIPRLIQAALVGGLTALGTLAAIIFEAIDVGYLSAFFKAQAHFQHGFHDPFSNLGGWWGRAFQQTGVVLVGEDMDVLLAVCIVAVLAVGLLIMARRGLATRWDAFLFLFVVVMWFFPGTQLNVAYYREDALLVPATALLMVRMGTGVSGLIAAGSVAVFPILAYAFFTGYVV